MKYRVKFKCYWYNTGAADNHYYINHKDFSTLDEAKKFKLRLQLQTMLMEKYDTRKISLEEFNKVKEKMEWYYVENGFVCNDEPSIVKHFPEREELL